MDNKYKQYTSISRQALQRLPYYLYYLKSLYNKGMNNVSSPMIAKELRLNNVQVRKDLAAVSRIGGKPRTGFDVEDLIQCIESYLGYNNINEAVLVGAGQLGRALLSYSGFENYGLRIVAAFDNNEKIINTKVCGKCVLPMEMLSGLCHRLSIHIGIITVPANAAQSACDKLIENGVLAIWNFAPVHLSVNDGIIVHNENVATSLAILSNHLAKKLSNTKK